MVLTWSAGLAANCLSRRARILTELCGRSCDGPSGPGLLGSCWRKRARRALSSAKARVSFRWFVAQASFPPIISGR